jgi:dienelactone hydrolase
MLKELQLDEDAPWKKRYRASSIRVTAIAANAPTRGLVLTDRGSSTVQWYAWDVATNDLRQLTHTPGGHAQPLYLSPDGRWVCYLLDKQGNEIGHYVRMPYEGGDPADLTPDLPPYASFFFHLSRNGRRLSFMAADQEGFHIYVGDVDPDGMLNARRELYRSPHLSFGALLSADGETAYVMSSARTGKNIFSLLAFDVVSGEQLAELWDGDGNGLELMVPSPLAGDARVLASTIRTGIETLLIWNPRTGERTDLTFEGVTGAIRAFDWAPDGQTIIFRTINQAAQQLYLHHLPSGKTTKLNYPDGTNFQPYFAAEGKEIFSHWQDPTQPTRLIALDPQTGAMTRTVLAAGDVPTGRPWRSVSFPSSDGQIIQGWLAVPEGEGPFLTIFETHGGPTAVQSNSFAPGAQAWLDHGFAYFTLNYRGSTTFGREFEQKIWGDLGHWEVEDMVAARNWLVENKISQPDSILLTGWSYGGYLTLMGLGKTPELWAGGMAGVAIADWAVQYEDSAETLRGYQRALFLGTPEEKPEAYRRSSPITYAEAVQSPVLIIQGRNDTRTPARPIEMYEAKMKELGKSIEVHWYDTGHAGSATSVEAGIKHQELMMRFAYRVLG